YDGAEASFELLVRRSQPDYTPPFELDDFMIVERRRLTRNGHDQGEMMGEAVVKVNIGGEVMHTAGEGNGPVNALDMAVRKALAGGSDDLLPAPGIRECGQVTHVISGYHDVMTGPRKLRRPRLRACAQNIAAVSIASVVIGR